MTSDVPLQLRQITRARFDAFAGYCRRPLASKFAVEMAWLEEVRGDVFATLIVDTDGLYSGVVFARDLQERFRCVKCTNSHESCKDARSELEALVASALEDLDEARVQGDEAAKPTDFFAPRVDETKQHPNFRLLASDPSHEPARRLIEEMMRWYEDRDGNFIQQFQTEGFDARIWELYLWATLVSLDLEAKFPKPSPDLDASGVGVRFAIEATTINPSLRDGVPVAAPKPESAEEKTEYFRNYLPVRFAGPLSSKLSKRYWLKKAVAGLPFVIAIQDFHTDFSMTWSGIALPSYLYGYDLLEKGDEESEFTRPRAIENHNWGMKTVPSGFFSLPEAENVSAVIFNPSGTLAKFNRMGLKVGFNSSSASVTHMGRRAVVVGRNYRVTTFREEVAESYEENWVDGMNVYHNPNAVHQLDSTWLPGAAHHYFNDGQLVSEVPDRHLFESMTAVVRFVNADAHRP